MPDQIVEVLHLKENSESLQKLILIACCITTSVQEEVPVELTAEERAAKAAELQAKIAEKKRIADEKDKQDAIMREKIRFSLFPPFNTHSAQLSFR